ncbi:TolC family protein [Thermosulfurimonas marina]|uniref:TolC family protein n=1 Tax=Thermosulfurimonas marina TaxID=2047767 RepID=A0A6H1WTM3_9BACT|nr:TolC family protein [Thermosulfurimonas marina]QJA06521.1 TolC family protein [Thermosulfurimonas marina]
MKPLSLILLVLFGFLSPALAGETLTLEEARHLALKANPEILARGHEVSAARAARRAEWGRLLPQVDLLAQYRRLSDPQAVIPIKGPGQFPAFSRDLYDFAFTLSLPLYEGGRLRRRVRIAELETAFRESLRRQTALDLLANVEETFYLGLYLKDLISAQEKSLEALRRLYRETRLKERLGRVPPLDRLRMETQLKAEEAALAASREALVRAKEALAVLLGRPPATDFELSGELPSAEGAPPEPDWERVLSCRPDLAAARAALSQAREAVRLAWGEHLPALELFSDYGRRAGAGLNHSEEVWEAGLRLRLNLFSGGTISSRVAEARARELAARERLRATELSARREVAAALSLLSQSLAEVEHYRAALASAREAFRVESLKYRTGAGTVTDTLLAQAAWFQAEADLHRAFFDYAKAWVAYRRATAGIAGSLLKLPCAVAQSAEKGVQP